MGGSVGLCEYLINDMIIRAVAHVNAYSAVRDSVNQRISTTYDVAVDKVKSTKGLENGDDIKTFERAMSSIAWLEGSKCGLFKQVHLCQQRQLKLIISSMSAH
ncbi:hypothetical protein ANCCAN_17796 [Ancylostoma caninum]|uniref:Uncharacterized protein n=1 Tax=Ancylostoma caninum TaxID=29170 RepID=A0A368FVW8_ANCCA|nr:hypothetical protein ANCCAN_17796 [Ancylostoma caninum]